MEDKLLEIYIKLDEIKEYICKLGPKRRTGPQYELDSEKSKSVRPDQPKLVEVLKKRDNDYEFVIFSDRDVRKYLKRYKDEIIYSSKKMILFLRKLNLLFVSQSSLSTISRDELLKELVKLCENYNIDEVVMIKNDLNKDLIEWLASYMKSNKVYKGPKFCILRDVCRIDDNDQKKVILNEFHLLPTSGHAGIRRMVNNIKKYYYWSSIENDVKNYVEKCKKCQSQKYTKFIKEPLTLTSTAKSSFEKVYLDLVGPLDRDDDNNTYILTLQCELTKYVEAYPLKNKSTKEVARAFAENFILRYGIPYEIATDRGTEFISSTMQELLKILNIKQIMSTAYHHESIGALENSHKMLGAYLRIQTNNQPSSWGSWVQFWCFSYNTTVHTETQYTPFELVFGQVCRIPTSLTNTVDILYNHDNYPLEFKFRLQRAQNDARNNLINSKLKRKTKYDDHISPILYKPGDKLMLKNETGTKLNTLYDGPYVVVSDNRPNVTILKDGKEVTVHKNRTKPCYE